MSRTLSIIKPDAVEKNCTGAINAMIEAAGFRIIGQKRILLTKSQAEAFYYIHKDRPFYKDLVEFMTSGPVIAQVLELEGPDAVLKHRDLMGATNPQNAESHTIRANFASDIERNAVHGSDSNENATQEIAFFFSSMEIHR